MTTPSLLRTINHKQIEWLILAIYLATIVYISLHHEMWRDEVRALSIVRESNSINALYQNLKTEGHPMLWYLVLYLGNSLTGSPLVLTVASLFITFLSVFVFIRSSPFPLFVKILFPFGFFPIFEYSVMCRNYCLGMLFTFLYCSYYKDRYRCPIKTSLILFFLAHTSIFGTILASAFLLSLVIDYFFSTSDHSSFPWLLVVIVIIGICLALIQMYPDSSSILTEIHRERLSAYTEAKLILKGILTHASFTYQSFNFPYPIFVPLLLLSFYIAFLSKPALAVFLFSVVTGIEAVRNMVYPNLNLRQQGTLFLALVAVLWLDRLSTHRISNMRIGWLEKARERYLTMIFSIILVLQVFLGAKYAINDINQPLSSAKALAELIHSTPKLQEAILMFEPDSRADTIPYYSDNLIYMPREKQFKKRVSYTKNSSGVISLAEIVDTALELGAKYQKPILALLPLNLKPGDIPISYGRSFKVSSEDLEKLNRFAKHIADFDKSPSSEIYSAYLFEIGEGDFTS